MMITRIVAKAGLRMLSGQAQSNLKDSMSKSAFSFYKPEFEEAMISLQKTIAEQNDKLSEIYAKAATFRIRPGLGSAYKTDEKMSFFLVVSEWSYYTSKRIGRHIHNLWNSEKYVLNSIEGLNEVCAMTMLN